MSFAISVALVIALSFAGFAFWAAGQALLSLAMWLEAKRDQVREHLRQLTRMSIARPHKD